MGIRFESPALGGIVGAYAAGRAKRRNNNRKYQMDALLQQQRHAQRMAELAARRGALGGGRAGGGGRMINPLAGPRGLGLGPAGGSVPLGVPGVTGIIPALPASGDEPRRARRRKYHYSDPKPIGGRAPTDDELREGMAASDGAYYSTPRPIYKEFPVDDTPALPPGPAEAEMAPFIEAAARGRARESASPSPLPDSEGTDGRKPLFATVEEEERYRELAQRRHLVQQRAQAKRHARNQRLGKPSSPEETNLLPYYESPEEIAYQQDLDEEARKRGYDVEDRNFRANQAREQARLGREAADARGRRTFEDRQFESIEKGLLSGEYELEPEVKKEIDNARSQLRKKWDEMDESQRAEALEKYTAKRRRLIMSGYRRPKLSPEERERIEEMEKEREEKREKAEAKAEAEAKAAAEKRQQGINQKFFEFKKLERDGELVYSSDEEAYDAAKRVYDLIDRKMLEEAYPKAMQAAVGANLLAGASMSAPAAQAASQAAGVAMMAPEEALEEPLAESGTVNPWEEVVSKEERTPAQEVDFDSLIETTDDDESRRELGQLRDFHDASIDPEIRQAVEVIASPDSSKDDILRAMSVLKKKGVDIERVLSPPPVDIPFMRRRNTGGL